MFNYEITWVRPLNLSDCAMTLDDVLKAVRPDTFLICAMAVNNELGTTNAIDDITSYAHARDIQTLVDCT